MPIRRCPYCKAIIEEGDEYCSNCGTQLLFPNDEKIEEEIPGEKIVEEEEDLEESKPPDKAEEAEEEMDKGEMGEKEIDQDEAEGTGTEAAEEEAEETTEEEEEESLSPDEKEEPSGSLDAAPLDFVEKSESGKPEEPIVQEEDVDTDESEEDQEGEEWDVEEVEEEDYLESDESEVPQKEPAADVSSEDFTEYKEIGENNRFEKETEDQQIVDSARAIDSSELEKQEIEKFIDSIRRDRGEEDESQETEESESLSPGTPGSELFKKEDLRVSTDHLPPWASKIKQDLTTDVPPAEEKMESTAWEGEERTQIQEEIPSEKPIPPDTGEGRTQIQEEIPAEKPIPPDTGVGLPEGVSQKDLPFSGSRSEEKIEIRRKKPTQFSSWIKSRLFDILIMAVVWLITVWIASAVMDVGLFRLIGASALLLGILYVILQAGYFFLFFFFLGETLGDYVLNEREKPGSRLPV